MRELKGFELERVTGGRANMAGLSQTILPVQKTTHVHITHVNGSANAEPFLLPALNPLQQNIFTRPPKNLPGGQKQQPSKGGPFTFKTPYLNR